MAKLYVTGVVEWVIKKPGIIVSVEDAAGRPVEGLVLKDFTVGRIGSGGGWAEEKINTIHSNGAAHGFYKLFVNKHKVGDQSFDWGSHQSNLVFTVEVVNSKSKDKDRGQALAINKCCGDDGMK